MTPKINPSFKKQQDIIEEINNYHDENKDFTYDDFKKIIYEGSEKIPDSTRSIERNINRYINQIRENFKFEIKIRKVKDKKIYFIRSNRKSVNIKNPESESKPETVQKRITYNLTNTNTPKLLKLINYDSKKGKSDYLIYPLEIVNNVKDPFFRGIEVSNLYNDKKIEYITAKSTKIKRFYFSRVKDIYKYHSVKCTCPKIMRLLKDYNSYKKDDFGFLYQKKSELNHIKLNSTNYFEMLLKSKYKKLHNNIRIDNRIKSINIIGKNGVYFNKELEIKFIHIDLLFPLILGHLNHVQIKNSPSAKKKIQDYLTINL